MSSTISHRIRRTPLKIQLCVLLSLASGSTVNAFFSVLLSTRHNPRISYSSTVVQPKHHHHHRHRRRRFSQRAQAGDNKDESSDGENDKDWDGIGNVFEEHSGSEESSSKRDRDMLRQKLVDQAAIREKQARLENAKLFTKRQEMSSSSSSSFESSNATLPPGRKFTGASLFSPDSTSMGSSSSSAASQREYQREFDLAGRFERTLGLQVAVLFVSLAVVIAVGLMGGITDGSDRSFGGADDIDESYTLDFWSQLQDSGRVDLESVGRVSEESVFL